MKKIFTILLLCVMVLYLPAAMFAENTAFYAATCISIKENTPVSISGDLVHNGDKQDEYNIFNAGEIYLQGNIQNKSGNLFKASTNSVNGEALGKVVFAATTSMFASTQSAQIINSTPSDTIYFSNMDVENTLSLNSDIHVQGNMVLQNKRVNLNGKNIYLFFRNNAFDSRNTGQIFGESNTVQVSGDGAVYAVKRAGQWNELAPLGFVSENENSGSIYLSRHNSAYPDLKNEAMHGYFKVKTTIENNSKSKLLLRCFDNQTGNAGIEKEIASVYSCNIPTVKRHASERNIQYYTSTEEASFIADTDGIFTIVSKCSNPPKIDMGDDIHICEGQDTLLAPKITGGSGRLFYFWDDIASGESSGVVARKVSVAGSYNLKVIDEKGCVGTGKVMLSTHPYPSPQISKSADLLCENEVVELVYSDTIPNCSVVWDFGDGTGNGAGIDGRFESDSSTTAPSNDTVFKTYPVGCAAYTITLTATTQYACSAQTQTQVRTETMPQASISLNFLTDTIADISVNVENTCSNTVAYKWFIDGNLGSTQQQFRYIFPKRKIYNISVEVSSSKCAATADTTIEILERAYLSFTSNKRKFCAGEEIVLENTSEINYGDFRFYWKFSDGKNYSANTVARVMEKAGMYIVSLTGESGGWIRTVADTIWVYENPVVQFPDSISTCDNQYILSVKNSIYDQYVWTDERDFYIGAYYFYIARYNGKYKLVQTNAEGCTASDSVVVILNERIKVELGADRIACDSITLDAGYISERCIWTSSNSLSSSDIGDVGSSVMHSDTGRFYTIKESGKITLRVESDSSCFGTDSINISIYKKPNASLGIDTFYCSSDSVLLSLPFNETGADIIWNDGSSVNEKWVKNKGIYSVTVSDSNGYCVDSSSVFVEEKQSPILNIPDIIFACNGDTVLLEMWDNILAEKIIWTLPDGQKTEGFVLQTSEQGLYNVNVKYANGCSAGGAWNVQKQNTSAVSSFLMASTAMPGDSVFLVNLSYPLPLKYAWEATNGFNSEEKNPVANFYREGIYAMTLGVANNECVVKKTKPIRIGEGSIVNKKIVSDSLGVDKKFEAAESVKDEILCKISPNPSSNIFKVEVENADVYYVTSLLGRKICSGKISGKNFVINAENWHSGIYLLHIKNSKGFKVVKIVKV